MMSVGFVLLCLIWGSTWLAIKLGLTSVPPFFGAAFRFFIALPILFVIMKLRGLVLPRDRESWNLFLIVGFFSVGIPFCLIYWSAQFLPSGLMSILFGIFPFVVAILSHFYLPGEPLNLSKIGGVILGFSGIVIIFFDGLRWDDSRAFLGMLAIVSATVMQASSMIVIKKRGKHLSPITLNFSSMLIGVGVLAAVALVFEDSSDVRWDAVAIGSIVYLATMGSVVTFVTYYWLLKRVEAVYLSLIAFVTPIAAVFLGALVLHERLKSTTFMGAAFVLVGILFANWRGLRNLIRKVRQKSLEEPSMPV